MFLCLQSNDFSSASFFVWNQTNTAYKMTTKTRVFRHSAQEKKEFIKAFLNSIQVNRWVTSSVLQSFLPPELDVMLSSSKTIFIPRSLLLENSVFFFWRIVCDQRCWEWQSGTRDSFTREKVSRRKPTELTSFPVFWFPSTLSFPSFSH